MDELKMILDTVIQLAATGGNVAIWWLVLHYGVKILLILAGFGAVVASVWLIVSCVNKHSIGVRSVKAIARAVDESIIIYDPLDTSDLNTILRAIDALKKRP